MKSPPKIQGAVGLVWKPTKTGWLCRWQARTNLVQRGWLPKTVRLWGGREEELKPVVADYICTWSNRMQDEMLAWGRGGTPKNLPFDGTWAGLVNTYQTDRDSNFTKLRYKTRETYIVLMGKIVKAHGSELVAETKGRHFKRWHEEWGEGGKVTVSRSCITMIRILVNFGASILEDDACEDAANCLSRMKFEMAKPRSLFLTAEHVQDIRKVAHEEGMPSIALAQAIQFEAILRQKDIIGEWVPMSEPGMSDTFNGNDKWLRGIRWEEIDQNLLLRHVTSKRGKLVEVPLGSAPMVVAELKRIYGTVDRAALPASGPVIRDEKTGVPYQTWRFRQQWRRLATEAGVPKEVRNMDSRAGAISEATDAGAPIEHVRQAAAHSQTQQTEKYSRNPAAKTANVLSIRAEARKRDGNGRD